MLLQCSTSWAITLHWNETSLIWSHISTILGLITDPHNDQLPVGLIALIKYMHPIMPQVASYYKRASQFVSLREITAERNYSTERNYTCLAIVSCINKWNFNLYSRYDITVHFDHQPRETMLKKCLSKAPRRLQRMMLQLQKYQLQKYQFTVWYKKERQLFVADTLSRAAVRQEV